MSIANWDDLLKVKGALACDYSAVPVPADHSSRGG